jgi:two-component system cell cycle sensor histidine kinase/response regulator CckA
MPTVLGWLQTLPFQDPLDRRRAAVLQVLLLAILGGSLVSLGLPFVTKAPDTAKLVIFSIMCVAAAGSALAWWRLRLGHLGQGVTLASLTLAAVIESFLFFGGFAPHPSVLVGSAFPLLVAALGGNRRLMVVVALLQGTAMTAVGVLQLRGVHALLPDPEVPMVTHVVSIWIILGLLVLGMDRMGVVMEQSVQDMRAQLEERQRAQDALRRSQDLLRLIMDSMEDPVALMDANNTFIFTNPACQRTLGATPLTVEAVRARLDARDVHAAVAAYSSLGQHGSAAVSVALRDATGAAGRRFDLTLVRTRFLDAPVLLVVGRDVTDRERLQHQLVHAQKMDGIGRLAGGVAHDFNNILLALGGHASLAEELLPPDHPARQDLQEIHKAASRAADLTRQLLTFSRRQVTQPTRLDPGVLLKDTTQLLRRLLGEDVRLELNSVPGLWTVQMDATQLSQVIMNLVVNARDAMPRGGRLCVELSNVDITPDAASATPDAHAGPHVCLTVRDEGQGMDDATRSRMFEPFFTTKPAGQGTGLGLAVCYGIVKTAGGHILVDSAPNRGTSIQVLVPRAPEGAALLGLPEPRAPAHVPGGVETVMLVEDEASVRHLLERVLTAAGYRVLAYPSGDDALDAMAAGGVAVDLLITDMVMPGKQGDEVAAAMRDRDPSLKVLLISGHSQSSLLQGPLPLGFHFLAKPFVPHVLLRQVRSILDGTTAPAAHA